MNLGVIIVAAGQGLRLGEAKPKAFTLLGGKPLYQWSLSLFATHPKIMEGVLVVPESEGKLKAPPFKVVVGGETRQNSVERGLEALSEGCQGVLVHDAARPFVTRGLIDRLVEKLEQGQNAIPLFPISETVKWVEGEKITKTVDRQKLMLAQTPQACFVSDLKRAFKEALAKGWETTDESSLLEKIGIEVFKIVGDPNNIKITTPSDVGLAEWLLEKRK